MHAKCWDSTMWPSLPLPVCVLAFQRQTVICLSRLCRRGAQTNNRCSGSSWWSRQGQWQVTSQISHCLLSSPPRLRRIPSSPAAPAAVRAASVYVWIKIGCVQFFFFFSFLVWLNISSYEQSADDSDTREKTFSALSGAATLPRRLRRIWSRYMSRGFIQEGALARSLEQYQHYFHFKGGFFFFFNDSLFFQTWLTDWPWAKILLIGL